MADLQQTTFQDLLDVKKVCRDLSKAVARQDLPAWRLAHPLCAAGAHELICCLKMSAQQLQGTMRHAFGGLQHVSRVECDTRQGQPPLLLLPWTIILGVAVGKLPKLVSL